MKPTKTSSVFSPGLLQVVSLLFLILLFRLVFGLCSEFWADEEKQVYLIGLKFFTTGQWPYFGAVANSEALIPGALQGILVGGPLFLCPIPEAPHLFLGLLSFGGLCFFSWYCVRRFPRIPWWFIVLWLMLAPWTLSYSTDVVNPSYVLVGSILFFTGFLETCPYLTLGLLPPWVSNLLMGFSLFWIAQFHLSAAVLPLFVLISFYFQFKKGKGDLPRAVLHFLIGSIIPLLFLLPTFLKYGLSAGLGGSQKVLQFYPENLEYFFSILARFLSFASFELPRFVGASTAARMDFFHANPWMIPFGALLFAAGCFQVLTLVVAWFTAKPSRLDWTAMKWFTFGVFLLIYGSFLLTHKSPSSHTYYVFLPVVMIYAFYCWEEWLAKVGWQKAAKVFLSCVVLYQAGLAYDSFKNHSLYMNRPQVVQAIAEKNYRLVGNLSMDPGLPPASH